MRLISSRDALVPILGINFGVVSGCASFHIIHPTNKIAEVNYIVRKIEKVSGNTYIRFMLRNEQTY